MVPDNGEVVTEGIPIVYCGSLKECYENYLNAIDYHYFFTGGSCC